MPPALAPLTLAALRRHVVAGSLRRPTTLAAAVERLGFVQADPIRAPARAQDLILRHRAAGYRAGDLERAYPALGLDEDVLYAYGFVTPATRRLLHPGAADTPPGLDGEVLAYVRAAGPSHPADVAARLGAGAERNAWGGLSRATTRALERLHARGLLRVARRDAGVRVYEAAGGEASGGPPDLSPDERLRGIVLLLVRIFAPLPEAALRRVLRYVPHVRHTAGLAAARGAIADLLRDGTLAAGDADGERWIWNAAGPDPREPVAVPRAVRFLAPFDPVVWDRRRFEQLWGWTYRFEAYTPAAQRERGYYALPLLWGDRVIGWANVTRRPMGRTGERTGDELDVALGFAGRQPSGADFTRARDAEVARLAAFLRPRPPNGVGRGRTSSNVNDIPSAATGP